MFNYKSLDAILDEASSLGVTLPHSENVKEVLSRRVKIGDSSIETKNSLAIHPMEGFDGELDGSPSELTFRRYDRFSRGGAGLFWFEATAICPESRSSRRQIYINRNNVDSFKRIAEMMHKNSDGAPIIMQLTHSGRFAKPDNKPAPIISYHNPLMNEKFMIDPSYPVATDEYLDTLPEMFAEATRLAKEAGFDGVDIKACHKYLLSEILSAFNREGKYGGFFENRARLYFDSVDAAMPYADEHFTVASRLAPYDVLPYPWGFGSDREDYLKMDYTEPDQLIDGLSKRGVRLINLTFGSPYINPHVNRPYDQGGYEPPEAPLTGVGRMIENTAKLKAKHPEIKFIGTGYTYLRNYSANIAAGAVEAGMTDMAGFGRLAFAYPDFANDILTRGEIDPKKCCITCSKCTQIMRAFGTTGCVVRDSALYAPIYREFCGK